MAHALFTSAALSMLGPLGRLEPIGRVALQAYFSDKRQPQITWAGPEISGARLQVLYWRWLSSVDETPSVLVLPAARPGDLASLMEMIPPVEAGVEVKPLPSGAPLPGLQCVRVQSQWAAAPMVAGMATEAAAAVVTGRMQAWTERTLSRRGLGFCPYTDSSNLAGIGLDGVTPAPICYAVSTASELPRLLLNFWQACAQMVEEGESRTSSIILAAPHWDTRWEDWYRCVFPVLEASVLTSGLGRELGIVCFHPEYMTPDDGWLARHRFGHMHPSSRLRRYVDEHDALLSRSLSNDALQWAASYQRRSPHAMINVRAPAPSACHCGGLPALLEASLSCAALHPPLS